MWWCSWPGFRALFLQGSPQETVEELGIGTTPSFWTRAGTSGPNNQRWYEVRVGAEGGIPLTPWDYLSEPRTQTQIWGQPGAFQVLSSRVSHGLTSKGIWTSYRPKAPAAWEDSNSSPFVGILEKSVMFDFTLGHSIFSFCYCFWFFAFCYCSYCLNYLPRCPVRQSAPLSHQTFNPYTSSHLIGSFLIPY